MIFQFPDGRKAVYGIPCEPADGLCDNQVDLSGKGICHHLLEAFTPFGRCCADAFVRIKPHKIPILTAFDVIRIIFHLRLVAGSLILMVGGNAGIASDTAFLGAVNRCGCVPADGSR